MSRQRIEIPGDWQKHDRHLYRLAQETGFGTVNRLLRHVANELSGCRTPAQFYTACATLHDAAEKHRQEAERPKKLE